MDASFIRERISALRMKKNISEYKMSLDLGHSKSYIQSISSGKALPSMSEFLYICEYLGITPKDFFDSDIKEPILVQQLIDKTKTMSEEDLIALLSVTDRIINK